MAWRRPLYSVLGAVLCAALLTSGAGAAGRISLGVFDGWGAFRDDGDAAQAPATPPRCFAIAEASSGNQRGAYATIGFWPGARLRSQLFVRLGTAAQTGRPVVLAVGERRFALVARGDGAWAAHARMDAAIVAAMRGARSMGISATGRNGARIIAGWRLAGAATAIDAAALGCAAPPA